MKKILLLEDDESLNRGIRLKLSKENILERVWGLDGQFVDDNTVAVNISRLKNKLGTECIANVRGLGYLWTGKVDKK